MSENKIIILPIFSLLEAKKDLITFLKDLKNNGFQIIVINDGNGEEQIFTEAASYAKVITHKSNLGKGVSLKETLKSVKEHYRKNTTILTMNWQEEITMEEIVRVWNEAFVNRSMLVIGKTANQNIKNILIKSEIRAFSYEMIDFLLTVNGSRLEYDFNVLQKCKKNGILIKEVLLNQVEKPLEKEEVSNDILNEYKNKLETMNIPIMTFFIDYIIFFLFFFFFGHAIASNIFGRIISSILEFNQKRANQSDIKKGAILYLKKMGILLLVEIILLILLMNVFHMNTYFSKILTEVFSILLYYGLNEFVFKDNKNQ